MGKTLPSYYFAASLGVDSLVISFLLAINLGASSNYQMSYKGWEVV